MERMETGMAAVKEEVANIRGNLEGEARYRQTPFRPLTRRR
jgi:hypothetical protein